MPTTYLFRVDGAKDNDEYFAVLRTSAFHVYAGLELRVGAAGWIPDLVKVVVEEPPDGCLLTLIELEATEPVALISCRKYLPENSVDILGAFCDYLDRVVRQCRSTADTREYEFARLKGILSETRNIRITTAGALRTSASFVEELPLIDQPGLVAQSRHVHVNHDKNERSYHGVVRLNSHEAKMLARCVMILDAVIRHLDHSGATFNAWRAEAKTQPLKRLLTKNGHTNLVLRSFIFDTRGRGITLDFETMLSELAEIWSAALNTQLDREQARGLISRYFPVASSIKGHESMAAIFETARKHVFAEQIQ